MLFRFFLIGVFLSSFAVCAFAENSHDRTQFGHDIVVGAGEEVSQVTCFGCSVRVRGHVAGDVTTFAGGVVVEDQGQIGGDLTSFGGSLRLEKEANIGGDVTVFGGRIRRDESAKIGGDVSTFTGTCDAAQAWRAIWSTSRLISERPPRCRFHTAARASSVTARIWVRAQSSRLRAGDEFATDGVRPIFKRRRDRGADNGGH